MSEKLLREALKAFDDGLGHLGRDILRTLIERAEQVQPAPSPQASGRRKGPPGITLEPQGHESPAVPVVSDEQIRKTVESIQDPDTVPAFHNGYYTMTPDELRRAILALRPAVGPMTERHPLMIFARECELGTYMEHETPMAARKAIGITAKADTVATDVARYRAIRDGLVYIEPHESGEIYVAGETGVYTKSGDEFDSAVDAIAASKKKG